MGQVISEGADRTQETDGKWAIPVWGLSYREVLGKARNRHSQEGSWLKWSPNKGRWSQRGQENDWLEFLDQAGDGL